MKIVIVTGGSGYIGSVISLKLLEQGFKVINLDRIDPNEILKSNINYRYFKQDISFSTTDNLLGYLENNFKGDSWYGVIHMAAWKSLPDSYNNPYEYYRNNLISTLNALNICQKLGCERFIFSSSAGVYKDELSGAVNEDDINISGDSPYGYTKVVGERLVKDICNQYRITSFNLRYCNPIGSYKGVSFDTTESLFGNICKHLNDGKFTICGNDYDTPDGTCIRDYIDVRDVADAHIYFLNKVTNSIKNITVNLGTGKGTSVNEICNIVQKLYPNFIYSIGPRRQGDAPGKWAEISKLQELGFKCQYNVKDTIKYLISEYSNK